MRQRAARSSALLGVGMCSSTRCELRSRDSLVLVLGDPGPHAHHLGQRPVGDALAVGEAAAAVPPDVSTRPSMYFSNSQASRDLPIPAMPMTETRCALRSSRSRGRAPSRAAARGRGRRTAPRRPPTASRPRGPATTRSAARAAPARLALQLVLAGVLVGDRRLGRALGGLADEHRARLGRRLDARGGVDEVAGDHALALGARG